MDKERVFAHYKKILDEMILHSNWFRTFIQRPCYMDQEVFGDGSHIPFEVIITTGATRSCIIDTNYDWVIKFDIEEDARGSACEREERLYARAKDYGVNQYFSEVKYLGEYHISFPFYRVYNIELESEYYEDFERDFTENEEHFGKKETINIYLPLYAYKKANENPSFESGYVTEDEKTTIREMRSPLSQRSLAVAFDFFSHYGMEEYSKLTNFLTKCGVNDLHQGNVGVIDDGPIIVDYGGYYEEEDEDEDENYYDEDEDESKE